MSRREENLLIEGSAEHDNPTLARKTSDVMLTWRWRHADDSAVDTGLGGGEECAGRVRSLRGR